MNEDNTFKKLRRTPFSEMREVLDEGLNKTPNTLQPLYKIGNREITRSTYYDNTMLRHYYLERILSEHGWTIIDFITETEKYAIKEQVEIVNQEFNLPNTVVERAKEFFPNLKFIPARLELNDE